jgi:hypothetical protein
MSSDKADKKKIKYIYFNSAPYLVVPLNCVFQSEQKIYNLMKHPHKMCLILKNLERGVKYNLRRFVRNEV